jgi:hypothetical protein
LASHRGHWKSIEATLPLYVNIPRARTAEVSKETCKGFEDVCDILMAALPFKDHFSK